MLQTIQILRACSSLFFLLFLAGIWDVLQRHSGRGALATGVVAAGTSVVGLGLVLFAEAADGGDRHACAADVAPTHADDPASHAGCREERTTVLPLAEIRLLHAGLAQTSAILSSWSSGWLLLIFDLDNHDENHLIAVSVSGRSIYTTPGTLL